MIVGIITKIANKTGLSKIAVSIASGALIGSALVIPATVITYKAVSSSYKDKEIKALKAVVEKQQRDYDIQVVLNDQAAKDIEKLKKDLAESDDRLRKSYENTAILQASRPVNTRTIIEQGNDLGEDLTKDGNNYCIIEPWPVELRDWSNSTD